eukprot:GILJ01026418.1.p1 GENE.GILJ01026418.1~~GILJ01026418.1.p1  ORF type:complete len:101 (-),score=13.42 GILJ01026418.1:447-749(-)
MFENAQMFIKKTTEKQVGALLQSLNASIESKNQSIMLLKAQLERQERELLNSNGHAETNAGNEVLYKIQQECETKLENIEGLRVACHEMEHQIEADKQVR